MKHPKLIYSDFVANRPEYTSLLELWCLLGGTITIIFISFDSGTGFSGAVRLETVLALVFPAIFFFLAYLTRDTKWIKNVLIISTLGAMCFSAYLYFYPELPHRHIPHSDVALFIFSSVAFLIVINNKNSNYETI